MLYIGCQPVKEMGNLNRDLGRLKKMFRVLKKEFSRLGLIFFIVRVGWFEI